MKVLRKESDKLVVLAYPDEEISVGDYVCVKQDGKELLLQVIDEKYLELEGIEEEILREEIVQKTFELQDNNISEIYTMLNSIKDMKLLVCKPRATVFSNEIRKDRFWLPSRSRSEVSKLEPDSLVSYIQRKDARITLGRIQGKNFSISPELLDGRITIVTGRKESGKSHLAKILLKGLVENNAYCFVFDLNDEYSDVFKKNQDACLKLIPGKNLRFSLRTAGLKAIASVLENVLDMPGTSLREFIKIWHYLEQKNTLTIYDFFEWIERWRCNEFVRDALFSRMNTLSSSGLITDDNDAVSIEQLFMEGNGKAFIISFNNVSPLNIRITVEIVLSKLTELLEKKAIPPVFLFAEEAHLYLRQTYWEDLITRMRHFGVFTIFITNQPDAIEKTIYRQADNFFVYNLTNESDLSLISQSSAIDTESLEKIVRSLPKKKCLALGHVVSDIPVVIEVVGDESINTGKTRTFFNSEREVLHSLGMR